MTWTDADGVVHVAAAQEAPASARPLEGGSYSVVDADVRPRVLPDGGTREADSASWRARLQQARGVLESRRLQERAAREQLDAASAEVCVTAEAHLEVPAHRRRRAGSSRVSSTETRCVRQSPSPALRASWAQRLAEREQAERELRALEQQALAARLPLADWR
ncbi:MAG: hypothetical protein ACOZQL_14135 [Myxococcota bacterium]